MGLLRRYDIAKGTPAIAGVVLPLNSVLVLLDLLPGLNLISASLVSLIARQSRGSGAEDEGRCEGNFGLGRHGGVSFAEKILLTEPFGLPTCRFAELAVNIDRTVQSR
jgi:hypothetical protein